MSDWDFENPDDTSGGVKPVGYSQSEIIIEQSGHPAVSIATPSPLTLSTQTLSLKNNAGSPAAITAVDTGALADSDTVVPTSKAVRTNVKGFTEYLGLVEMTAPTGAANNARIYAVDNGAGKTKLMVIFGSGSAVQLAIEP